MSAQAASGTGHAIGHWPRRPAGRTLPAGTLAGQRPSRQNTCSRRSLRVAARQSASVRAKHIALAPDGLDVRPLGRVGLNLAPQPGNAHIDTAVEGRTLGTG